MPVNRRELLLAAVMLPAGALVGSVATRAAEGLRAAAAQLRPPAQGTSASRCAACGAPDHTMLDPRCPAARRVF